MGGAAAAASAHGISPARRRLARRPRPSQPQRGPPRHRCQPPTHRRRAPRPPHPLPRAVPLCRCRVGRGGDTVGRPTASPLVGRRTRWVACEDGGGRRAATTSHGELAPMRAPRPVRTDGANGTAAVCALMTRCSPPRGGGEPAGSPRCRSDLLPAILQAARPPSPRPGATAAAATARPTTARAAAGRWRQPLGCAPTTHHAKDGRAVGDWFVRAGRAGAAGTGSSRRPATTAAVATRAHAHASSMPPPSHAAARRVPPNAASLTAPPTPPSKLGGRGGDGQPPRRLRGDCPVWAGAF